MTYIILWFEDMPGLHELVDIDIVKTYDEIEELLEGFPEFTTIVLREKDFHYLMHKLRETEMLLNLR